MSNEGENLDINVSDSLGFMIGESLYIQFPEDGNIFEEDEKGETFIVFDVFRVIGTEKNKITKPNENLTEEEVDLIEKAVNAVLDKALEQAKILTGELE